MEQTERLHDNLCSEDEFAVIELAFLLHETSTQLKHALHP